jgi:DNA-binding CsgD family transcriptional regulator
VSASLPAREILDALAFIGAAPDWEEVCARTLQEMARLVPADQYYSCTAQAAAPGGREVVSLAGPVLHAEAGRSYIGYYYRLDPARRMVNPSVRWFQVDWRTGELSRSEFASDFMRGLMRADMSGGIPILSPDGRGGIMFGFTRSRARPLAVREAAILGALRPHLDNLYRVHRRLAVAIGNLYTGAELRNGARLLSRREAEIATLLCQRQRPGSIAVLLGISPRTVERHVEHIYAKLGVGSRQELLRTLLAGPRGTG